MTVSISNIFTMPLAFSLAVVVCAYLYYMIRREPGLRAPPPTHIYRCDSCGRVYADPRAVPMARCPHCGTLNEAVRRGLGGTV